MFSGIIENSAQVESIALHDQGARLVVSCAQGWPDLRLGESIALAGVCLTLVAFKRGFLEFDVASETLRRSTLGQLTAGLSVNLERSLTLGERICGHLVFGHVDTMAKLDKRELQGETLKFSFTCAKEYLAMLAPKGSVALDGVSLTVGEVWAEGFSVYLIPHSAQQTTLGSLRVGSMVNLEVDMLARYLVNFLKTGSYVRAAA